MEMQSVTSRAISAVGYDGTNHRMKILFNNGKIYDFCNVPRHIYEEILSASSKGTYYNKNIRGRYQC
jgi:KTSC domain